MTSKSDSGSNVHQGKTLLQNPFEFSDDQILNNVYRTHFHCVQKCNVQSLHTVASTVINHSIQITDTLLTKVIILLNGLYVNIIFFNKLKKCLILRMIVLTGF